MVYQVNEVELGINQVLQLIEVTLGEGKLCHINYFLIYVYNALFKKISFDVLIYFNFRTFREGIPLAHRNNTGACKQVGDSQSIS